MPIHDETLIRRAGKSMWEIIQSFSKYLEFYKNHIIASILINYYHLKWKKKE